MSERYSNILYQISEYASSLVASPAKQHFDSYQISASLVPYWLTYCQSNPGSYDVVDEV